MKRYLILLLNCPIILCCLCCNKSNNSDIKIDLSIKSEVEKHISDSSFAAFFEEDLTAYYNKIDVEIYSGNSDTPRIIRSDTANAQFESFYYAKNDTIILWGGYNFDGRLGFIIKIINDQFQVYHLAASLGDPRYSLTQNRDWKYHVEVPCLESKVILSQKPSLKSNEVIYGYIELKSKDYYYKTINLILQAHEDEETGIVKSKSNMKIYFKSIFMDYQEPE